MIYRLDSVIQPLNWLGREVYEAVLYRSYNYFSYEQSFLLGLLCFQDKIRWKLHGRPEKFSWLSFEKRVQAPEVKSRASNKGVQAGPRRRRGKSWEGFDKKTARTTFTSTPNIRKLSFWSAELELIHFWRSRQDDKHVMQTARKYLRLHSVWSVTTPHLSHRPTYSALLPIWISFGYNKNSISYKYINIHTLFLFFCFLFFVFFSFHFFLYLYFIFCVSNLFIFYYYYYFVFFVFWDVHVPGFIDG